MTKTPEELAFEWWTEYSRDKDLNKWDTVDPVKAFTAGFQAGYGKGYCDAANTDWDSIVEQAYKQLDKNNENT